MTIGLYDLDLWHGKKSCPNLELMQIYNYFYTNNHIVRLLKPNDSTTQYSKIFYFKDNATTKIPRKLTLSGADKNLSGFGFFGKNQKLNPAISQMAANYKPYVPWTNKLKANFDDLQKSSYVRLETENFGDYDPSKKIIYFADNNFLELPNAFDFLDEHLQKHEFNFVHTPKIKDDKKLSAAARYFELLHCPCQINYLFSTQIFLEYSLNYHVSFPFYQFPTETQNEYLMRIIKMGLWYKKHNKSCFYYYKANSSPMTFLHKWIQQKDKNSFYQAHNERPQIIQWIESQPYELRYLLKTSPDQLTEYNIQF